MYVGKIKEVRGEGRERKREQKRRRRKLKLLFGVMFVYFFANQVGKDSEIQYENQISVFKKK